MLWEGSFFAHHSFANVNRELVTLLAVNAGLDLGLVARDDGSSAAERDAPYEELTARVGQRPAHVDIYVRHRWPPDFTRPHAPNFVLVQPYEYGFAPEVWVRSIAHSVDELWVPSRFVRDAYLRSGVDVAKVQLIPFGANPERFNPGIEPFPVRTEKAFKFLFVGGTIYRKGFDLLLRAYREAFTSDDDVTLVVKDFFYGPHGRELVRALRRDPTAPEIRYGYGTMDPARLGGLYTACDCYVHPYRGEGFGLPILEAMACGLPVITTGNGPALDYCTEDVAYLVRAREVPFPYDWPEELRTVQPPTWFEPDLGELRRLMRQVFEQREPARQLGLRAREHVRSWTWDRAAAAVVRRFRAIAGGA